MNQKELLEIINEAAKSGATSLFLSDNNLTSLPAEIGQLKKLKKLFLNSNNLTSLPAEIGQLKNLTTLFLNHNSLTSLPAEIGQLKKLTELELRDNKLTSLPPKIGQLKDLATLWLRGNSLTTVDAEIGQLKKLSILNLDGNNLTSLPAEIGQLKKLTELWVEANNLTSLPAEIAQLINLNFIKLNDNPLKDPPPEIIKGGIKAIRNYFESLIAAEKKGEGILLYEAKLLVVGPGDVGKTFLSNRLIHGKTPPTDSTEGIDIHKWTVDTKSIKGFRINLWDFGGQEIYHATHQFFLTKRSLYLFVWQARSDDDRVSFGYWLNIIKLLSADAPVIMVMNKCDERRKSIDQAAIQKQFNNVIGFYEVSAERNDGIEDLRGRIIEEIEKLEHIGTTLPKQWVDIREQLEGMKETGNNYITYESYQSICCTGHKLNKDQAGYLAGYYHELGVILHFADNLVLRDIVFLNPEWATDAVYAVADNEPIKKNNGRFHFDELQEVWGGYPEDKYAALLELMMKFELCFNLEGTKEYIIPELLRPERCSFKWSYPNNLHFEYKYDFMPAGIITRFMVRKHNLIKDGLHWRNGAVMEWEGTEALIESNEFEGKVDIWIRGEDKKGMLGIIRCDIEHIHETLNRPVIAERMPCICSECKNSTNPHFYNYHDLRTLMRKNVWSTRCMKSAEKISIDVLLGSYGINEKERERGPGGRDDLERRFNIRDSKVVIENGTKIERYSKVIQEKVINIGDGNTIDAPVVVAHQIENSFNTVAESDIKGEIKDLLHKLISEVNEAAKSVPVETAELMARDVESLSKEVVCSKPRRKWYEMSVEGLKGAAQAVGDVGKPILNTVSKLLPILNDVFGR